MKTPETICRLVEAMASLKYEKDREFVKEVINLLKSYLDREDEYNQLLDRVGKLESIVSFLRKEQS